MKTFFHPLSRGYNAPTCTLDPLRCRCSSPRDVQFLCGGKSLRHSDNCFPLIFNVRAVSSLCSLSKHIPNLQVSGRGRADSLERIRHTLTSLQSVKISRRDMLSLSIVDHCVLHGKPNAVQHKCPQTCRQCSSHARPGQEAALGLLPIEFTVSNYLVAREQEVKASRTHPLIRLARRLCCSNPRAHLAGSGIRGRAICALVWTSAKEEDVLSRGDSQDFLELFDMVLVLFRCFYRPGHRDDIYAHIYGSTDRLFVLSQCSG
ncbi:uncharacterized protein BKA78DRAFT_96531 [Phyllosticta capitalensis]|uniref:uncharacterized protein n=1 Tax=Phyllosticta capitalensis TaxID=121624 RepID=UPI00312F27A3